VPNLSAALAAGVVLAHVAFIAFVVLGGLAAARWPRVAWVHVPCALWAIYVELSGTICPLTPLENELRTRAGLDPYSGDFIARYVFPVLYPVGLTRGVQIVIGAVVLVVNLAVYGGILVRRRRRP
jgi:ABC-type uncharacterized transport system permease subunit